MENLPNKIYLNIGCDQSVDFKELSEVTWSQDRISKDCIEYVLAEHQARQQPVREKALDFLHSKGIESATCYTNKDTYYIKDLANLIEEYAKSSKAQQPVRESFLDVLEENYRAAKNDKYNLTSQERSTRKKVIQTYEGLISIYKANFENKSEQPVRKTLDRYDIDFGGNVMAGIEVEGQINIVGAMDGYGNGISLDKIIITPIAQAKAVEPAEENERVRYALPSDMRMSPEALNELNNMCASIKPTKPTTKPL